MMRVDVTRRHTKNNARNTLIMEMDGAGVRPSTSTHSHLVIYPCGLCMGDNEVHEAPARQGPRIHHTQLHAFTKSPLSIIAIHSWCVISGRPLEHQRHVSQDERDARRPARHRATDEKYEQRDEGREAGRQGDPTAHLPTKARAHGDSGHLGTLARYSAVRPRPRLRLACNG